MGTNVPSCHPTAELELAPLQLAAPSAALPCVRLRGPQGSLPSSEEAGMKARTPLSSGRLFHLPGGAKLFCEGPVL